MDLATDEQVIAACKIFFGELWTFTDAELLRAALNAALALDPRVSWA